MIKLKNTEVVGWEHAIRGMRNPMNSWDKSDSHSCGTCGDCDICIDYDNCPYGYDYLKIIVGPNDLDLMTRLRNAGTDHRKFMRMITVYVDITAPLYWWKEFDTYKVGTVANSCSTMHKIHEKEFTLEDFSTEHLIYDWVGDNNEAIWYKDPPENGPIKCQMMFTPLDALRITIGVLNTNREAYLKTKNKKYWWQMIQLLPSSYNQRRTVMMNYEVLANIYKSRRNHKLDEWHTLCDWIEGLPYSELITERRGEI